MDDRYYDEFDNKFYNPDDDDAKPGANLNWKKIQRGFKRVEDATAEGYSLAAEGYAIGTQNGEPVEEGSPYYQNNAKYYADDAGEAAQLAEEVAQSIPEDYTTLSNDVSVIKSELNNTTITETVSLTSGKRFLYSNQTVGSTPVLTTGNGKYAVFDVSYAKDGGTIELEIDSITTNSTVATAFTDENDIIISRVVTSSAFTLDQQSNKYVYTVKNPLVRKVYLSIYGGSDSVTVKLTPVRIGAQPDIVYVSSAGSDANSGLSASRPLATIKKAIGTDAKQINLLSDIYESVSISGKCVRINGNGFTIYGDTVLTTESYNGIIRAAYSADTRITNCFVDKTTPLTEEVSGSEWKGDRYNIACYADDRRLLPVEDLATCESTTDSFTWDDGYFYINAEGTRFSYATNANVINANKSVITCNDLIVKHSYSNVINTIECDIELNGCKAIGSVNTNCVYVEDGNICCNNVEASMCWNDGLNTHGKGNSSFIDCYCHNCSDDGISQHGTATGVIIGGEFCNCGKGGISSPINSAKVDIYGAYCHDNDYGIYASSSEGTARQFKIFGCVVKENRIGLKIAGHTALIYQNVVTGNTTNTQTESGGSIVDLSA